LTDQQQLAVREASAIVTAHDDWDAAKRDLLANTIAKGATSDELELFIAVCRRTGLDPFLKQIYFVKYGGKVAIQVGIDGYRALAERTTLYGGQIGPEWADAGGDWHDVWLEDGPPTAARVGVIRKDWDRPVFATCRFKSYVKATDFWRDSPDNMLAKCAESLAFRKAFPTQLGGYAARPPELDDSDRVGDGALDAPGPSRGPAITAGIDAALAEADALLAEPAPKRPIMQPEDFFRDDEPTAFEQEQPPGDDPLAARRAEATALYEECRAAGMRVGPPHPQATEIALDDYVARHRRMLNARAGRP
jgi:phage recombination protein Bet